MAWYERLDMWVTLVIVGFVSYLMVRDRVRGLVAFAGGRLKVRTIGVDRGGIEPVREVRGSMPVRGHLTDQAMPHPSVHVEQMEHPTLDRVAPFFAWWTDVVKHTAHIMIVGETRSGKSTTARALLAWRARTDAIVILDPHAKFSDWGGLEVIGNGRDFAAIARAMLAIDQEFQRRFKPGEALGDPLTVFIDEYPSIVAARPELATLVKTWLREAAKTQIRLVFLTQDPSVKALGVEGEGAVRLNMWSILLGSFAAKASPVAATSDRPAALQRLGHTQAVSVSSLPFDASQEIDPSVLWQMPEVETTPQPFQPTETNVSPVAITQTDDDDEFRNVDFAPLARLVKAKLVGETKLLETAFDVKPGSSVRYKAAQSRLKAAIAALGE